MPFTTVYCCGISRLDNDGWGIETSVPAVITQYLRLFASQTDFWDSNFDHWLGNNKEVDEINTMVGGGVRWKPRARASAKQ